MDCTRCAEDLTAYLDGELSDADAGQVRSHLAVCPACAGQLAGLREAAGFVKSHPGELEVRPEMWNLVRARISARPEFPSLFRFLAPGRWRYAMAAVAVAVVFALGYIHYQQVQRKSLDQYISRYLQERQTRMPSPPAFADFRASLGSGDSRAYNPFADLKDNLTDNPFRSEDR